jgi:hypothetical protein
VGTVVDCVRDPCGSICRVQVGRVTEDGLDVGVEVGIELLLEVGACSLECGVVRVGLATSPGRLGGVACCDEIIIII